MKKLMIASALVAASVLFAGCGGKPKIPAKTVAAAYLDLDKTVWNVADVVETVIGELPKEMRKEAEAEYEKFLDEHKKDIKAIDAEWACITVEAGSSSAPDVAVVIKCDCKEKIPSAGKSLEELAAAALEKVDTISGCDVYAYVESGFGSPFHKFAGCSGVCIAFVDGKYIVCTSIKGFDNDESKAFACRMIDLYKNGKGEKSGDFGDLTDLEDDTVLRIQTAEVATVAEILGAKERIEQFGKEIDDEDLTDMLLDIENITLDVNLSDDVLGFVYRVDAGSRELAKVVESSFNVAKFACRVYSSVGPAALGDALSRLPFLNGIDGQTAKAIGKHAREAVEVDRSGSTATFTVELDTEDLIEDVVEALFSEGK